MYEVYSNSDNTELHVENLKTHEVNVLKDMGIEFLSKADSVISTQYPTSYAILLDQHGKGKEFTYARVRHFFACNFSVKDGTSDIDEDWNFNLERVPCPARLIGICDGGVCKPEINNQFTQRELEVLSLYVKGFRRERIAAHLFISDRTVGNHINNMYRKIPIPEGVNPEIALVNYAYIKQLV